MTTRRVLVADDQTLIREALALLLGSLPGIEIIGTAGDGVEAVAMAAALRPDVVLMDLRMPKLDGVAATRQLAERMPQLPVIALSTYVDDPTVRAALQAGAKGYLTKDATPTQIEHAVRTVCAGGAVFDPAVHTAMLSAVQHSHREHPTPRQGAPNGLTPREVDVLQLVATGLSNAQIARRLHISTGTVKTHLNNTFAKIGAINRGQAVGYAYRSGLTHP